MANHRSKPHQIRFSETGKPYELPPKEWLELTTSGIAKVESDTKAARIAVIRLPWVGLNINGSLFVSKIGASIKSTWLGWDREWLVSVTKGELQLQHAHTIEGEAIEDYAARIARVERERETAMLIEALEWKSTRHVKGGRNSFHRVTASQLAEVLTAFGRTVTENAGN